jgi:hypothetical protein
MTVVAEEAGTGRPAGEEAHLPENSVLRGLPEFEWSASDAVRYEVALEMLGVLMAACTDRLTREQSKPSPDPAVIAAWRRRRTEYVEQQADLRSDDAAAIDAVLSNVEVHHALIRQER